jgi:two-component system CheB/CheR fusion protein
MSPRVGVSGPFKGLENLGLIAITGYGTEADRHRSRSAGFEDHLVKPVDLRS